MKVAHFLLNVFEVQPHGHSECIFAEGSYHGLNAKTQRQIDLRNAEEVDAPDDVEKALAVAEKAEAKAESAVDAAEAARAAAEAAKAVAPAA